MKIKVILYSKDLKLVRSFMVKSSIIRANGLIKNKDILYTYMKMSTLDEYYAEFMEVGTILDLDNQETINELGL